jgi:hypothetical protein
MPLTYLKRLDSAQIVGADHGPQPTPSSAIRGRQGAIPRAKNGSRGTRADRGVRPTIYAESSFRKKTKWHCPRGYLCIP